MGLLPRLNILNCVLIAHYLDGSPKLDIVESLTLSSFATSKLSPEVLKELQYFKSQASK